MKVLDLFSGVGGFSTGFKQAGYEIIAANEIDKEIALSYAYNHPETQMFNIDIKQFVDICHIFHDKIDVIIGGPPCQGFSMAGKRIRSNDIEIDDPRNLLFKEYVKVIEKVEPKYFVMENVKGMKSLDKGSYFKMAKEELSKVTRNGKKYYIYERLVLASDFGVPQQRERLLIIGAYKPLDMKYIDVPNVELIEEFNYSLNNNIYDAISDLNYLESGDGKLVQEYIYSANTRLQYFLRGDQKQLYNHIATNHSKLAIDRMSRVPQGKNRTYLKEAKEIKSVHSGAYGRMEWDSVAKTVITRFDTPSSGQYTHPELNRTITPREAARLQTFPDSIEFIGSKTSISKQIGNAVPPMLALYLAKFLLEMEK